MDNTKKKQIYFIASDHAGFEMKELIKEYIQTTYKDTIDLTDMGCDSITSVDYPDYAEKACKEIVKNESNKGILICGSGIGISMAANKFKGIRCALCHDYLTAKLSREHNDANVVAFGGRIVGSEVAKSIIDGFFTGSFSTESKHHRRVEKIGELLNKYGK